MAKNKVEGGKAVVEAEIYCCIENVVCAHCDKWSIQYSAITARLFPDYNW